MKRIGVAGLITRHSGDILLGRRGKDPNRGLYVLPGGGLQEGESLEAALCREVEEETGYKVLPDPERWNKPIHIIELDDRLVLIAEGQVINHNDAPIANSDLYDVGWFGWWNMPQDLSPPVSIALLNIRKNQLARIYADAYHDPYDYTKNPPGW